MELSAEEYVVDDGMSLEISSATEIDLGGENPFVLTRVHALNSNGSWVKTGTLQKSLLPLTRYI